MQECSIVSVDLIQLSVSSLVLFSYVCNQCAFILEIKRNTHTHTHIHRSWLPAGLLKNIKLFSIQRPAGCRALSPTYTPTGRLQNDSEWDRCWDQNSRESEQRGGEVKTETKKALNTQIQRDWERIMCHSHSNDSSIWIIIFCCITASVRLLCDIILTHMWKIT